MFPTGRVKLVLCLISLVNSYVYAQNTCNLGSLPTLVTKTINDLDGDIIRFDDLLNTGGKFVRSNCNKSYNTHEYIDIQDQSDTHIAFKKINMEGFEENEDTTPQSIKTICLTLTNPQCGANWTQNVYFLIEDTNNHNPEFINKEYSLTLPIPFPKTIEITQFGTPIEARDIDIRNQNIVFTVEPSGYFEVISETTDPAMKKYTVYMKPIIPLTFDEKEFTITATDQPLGTEKTRTDTAKLVIKRDAEASPAYPKFEKIYYQGSIKEGETELGLGEIKLEDGDKAILKLEGDEANWFTQPVLTQGQVTFALNQPLDVFEKSFVVLTLIATVDDQSAKSAIIISIPPPATTTQSTTETTQSSEITSTDTSTSTDPSGTTTTDPSGSSSTPTDPSSSSSTSTEPSTSISTTTDPSGSSSTNTELSSTSITTTNPSGSTTTSTDPSESTITSTDPSGSTITSTDPSGSTITSTDPSGSTITSTDPSSSTITSTDPSGSTITSTDPSGSTITSTDPSGSTITSTDPSGSTITSTDPSGSTITSTDPSGSTSTSTDPSGSTITSTDPSGSTITSTDPSGSTITSTDPSGSTSTSSDPSGSTSTSTDPSGSTGTSNPSNPTTTIEPTTPTGRPMEIIFKPYVSKFTLSGYESGEIYTFEAKSSEENDEIEYSLMPDFPFKISDGGTMSIRPTGESNSGLSDGTYNVTITARGTISSLTKSIPVTIYVKATEICPDGIRLTNALVVKKIKEKQESISTVLEKDFNMKDADYKYCIAKIKPNIEGLFFVNQTVGDIQCNPLNREADYFKDSLPQFTLTIRVEEKDKVCPEVPNVSSRNLHNISMYDDYITNDPQQTTVTIIVDDINDNHPIFDDDEITVCYPNKDIVEDVRPIYIAQAKATDKDSIENGNGVIKYSTDSQACIIDEDNGYIYGTSQIFDQAETIIEVAATDMGEEPLESTNKLKLKVKLVDKEKIGTLTLKGVRVDALDEKLKELSEKSGYTLKSFGTSAKPFKESNTRSVDDLSLQVLVYALDGDIPIDTNNLKEKLEGVADLNVSNYEPPPATNGGLGEDEATTGLLISTAVLGVLLVLVVGSVGALWYFKYRKPSLDYYDMESGNDLSGNSNIKESTSLPGDNIYSNSPTAPAPRRLTGFIPSGQLPGEDDDDSDVVDGDDDDYSSISSSTTASSSSNKATSITPPPKQNNSSEMSRDNSFDNVEHNVLQASKSVTFNNTVEEYKIEKTSNVESSSSDNSDDETDT